MTIKFQDYLKLHKISIALVAMALLFYFTFSYHLLRTDFLKLITLYTALFFLTYKLMGYEKWNTRFLLAVGILFRLVPIIAVPNLSQDFYRFIWDGNLVLEGINPYLFTPDDLMDRQDTIMPNMQLLYDNMGDLSARNYSSYPPLNQLFFALFSFLGGKSILGNIIAFRLGIIGADLGIVYFGKKLLRRMNLSQNLIFWYFLNPLVIIELTGNLHFEGLMLFFFVWGMYQLSIKKWTWAGFLLGCSISIKLIPLMFMPLFVKNLGFKKSILFFGIVGTACLLFLLPFYTPGFYGNYMQTLRLWFSNFEFNAGIYTIIEKIAIHHGEKPWEFIKDYGRITSYLMFTIVLLFTILRRNKDLSVLFASMLWILTLYYLLTPTVHPWYIIPILLISLFTKFRFPILWSVVIMLSYYAYSQPGYKENTMLLALEYLTVLWAIGYELLRRRNKF